MSHVSRTAKPRTAVARVVVALGVAFAACAFTSYAAAPAQADPGICIDHVMENGYEATASVLKACKIGKTGHSSDVRTCRQILSGEGVRSEVATYACRIASYPEQMYS